MQAAPEPRAGGEADDALARERAFYDAAAAERRAPGRTDTYDLALLEACGDIDGLRVLELGCGAGDLSVELLRRGARLTAIDISPGMVEVGRIGPPLEAKYRFLERRLPDAAAMGRAHI